MIVSHLPPAGGEGGTMDDRYRYPIPCWDHDEAPNVADLPRCTAIYIHPMPLRFDLELPSEMAFESEGHTSLHFLHQLLKKELQGSDPDNPIRRLAHLEFFLEPDEIAPVPFSLVFQGAMLDLVCEEGLGFKLFAHGEEEGYIVRVEDEIHALLRLCELRYEMPVLSGLGVRSGEGLYGEIYHLTGPGGEILGTNPYLNNGQWEGVGQ